MFVPPAFHVLHGLPTLGLYSCAYVLFVLVPCMGLSMFSSETEGGDEETVYVQEDALQSVSAANT